MQFCMLAADCCCFCSVSTDVAPLSCHRMNYVTALVGYECGCEGGGGKKTNNKLNSIYSAVVTTGLLRVHM